MDIQGLFQGQTKRLADIIAPLQKIAKDCASTAKTGGCSILELIQEMRRRHATSDIDKIAGLSFLLLSEALPRYYNAKTPEEAWVSCSISLRYIVKLELLYNFPFVRSSGPDELDLEDILWTPTWSQIIQQPAPILFYDRPKLSTKAHIHHSKTLWTLLMARYRRYGSKPLILEVFDAFVIEECEILEGTYLCNEKEKYIRYIIQVNSPSQQSQAEISFVLEFCSPRYRVGDGIGTQNCDNPCILPPILPPGKYILVTHSLDASSGWVIGKQRDVHPRQEALTVTTWKDQIKDVENELVEDGVLSPGSRPKNRNSSQDRHVRDHPDECKYFIEKVGVVNTEDIGRLKESGCLSGGKKCYFC